MQLHLLLQIKTVLKEYKKLKIDLKNSIPNGINLSYLQNFKIKVYSNMI